MSKVLWECANDTPCAWVGTDKQKTKVQDGQWTKIKVYNHVCPKCGGNAFYRVKETAGDEK